MFCNTCNKQFPGQCTCSDRDERLENLKGAKHLGLRWCKACDKHADLCKCADGPSTAVRVVRQTSET